EPAGELAWPGVARAGTARAGRGPAEWASPDIHCRAGMEAGLSASILIVDDEKNIRTSLSRSLSIEGYRCDTTGSVKETVEAFPTNPYDLVMLDVQLPDGSGLDLLAEIKRARPDVPVLVMSGHGTIDMALEAIRLGAHDFIEKPLSIDKILI